MMGTKMGTNLRCIAAGIAALTLLAACGDTDAPGRGMERRAAETRALAERLEEEGELEGAFAAYKDATRRYPTDAWPWSGFGRVSKRLGRFGAAEDAFRSAIRWDSTHVEACDQLAEILHAENRAEEALGWIDTAIRRDTDSPARMGLRARILADLGRHNEARRVVDRAIARAPADVSVRTASVYCRLEADEPAPAMVELDALADHVDDPRVHEERARILARFGDDAGAIESLKAALAVDPHRPRARRTLAHLLFISEHVPEASEEYRVLLENDARDAVALEGLGSCARATGDEATAEEAFRRAIDADPEYAPAYLALGRLVASAGRGDDAVSFLRKARARALRKELWIECSLALGDAYLKLGEADHALEVADAILLRHEDTDEARGLRGRALAADGAGSASGEALERLASRPGATREEVLTFTEWLLARNEAPRALALVDSYLSGVKEDAEAHVLRARALAGVGRAEEAETALHDLLNEEAASAVPHLALARLYLAEGRHPDALFHCDQGEALDGKEPEFAVVRGLAALAEGRLFDARAAFERERTLAPDTPAPLIHLGEVEMKMGHPKVAATLFERAQELSDDNWRPAYLLALAHAEAGRPQEAIKAYRTVLASDERVAEAHNNLAWLLADLDLDPVLAEVHARRAAELAPRNANVLGTLGWAQYKNRLLNDAAATLQRAVTLRPDDAMKQYMLGVVEFHRGRGEEARYALATALERDPGFERADRARDLLARLTP